ncbi:hypothetical protein GGF46_000520 [Coemansia sp. RSA 552]|nr:hypothetical protein GGF46_000520 [Coemansia sp. RSA 552]
MLDSEKQFAVGPVLVHRVRRVCKVLLSGQTRDRIGLWCVGLVAAKLAAEAVYYYAGTMPSEFYRVLGDKDAAAFFPLLARCVGVVTAAGTCKAAIEYLSGLLGVVIRLALTRYTHWRYLRRQGFYTVASGSSAVDNPDQRITQDIERLAGSATDVLAELLIAPFLIAYYSYRCWAISGAFGPLAIYVYFAMGAVVTRWAMAPIIQQVYRLEQAEGDFRSHQVRVGEFAESIAFYGGEDRERAAADRTLANVVAAQRRVLWRRLGLGLATHVFSYLGSTVSYVIIGIPILMGVYDDKSGSELSSIISLNAFVSIYLIYRFTVVIEQTKRLADLAGYTARVVQLWEELDQIEAKSNGAADRVHVDEGSTRIVARDLTVAVPGGPTLVSGLNLDIGVGDSLLITGPNGSGKTSVLRTLCGLWPAGSGEVRLPANAGGAADVFFLSQTTYITSGSMRDQISYPQECGAHGRGVCTDDELRQLLETVGLGHLEQRLGWRGYDQPYSVQAWQRLLSPGEQQKLSVARVLFQRPTFAALDECTSAVDAATEAQLSRALVDAGITLVSVSHHEALAEFHRWRLRLDGRGGHELTR